MASIMVVITTSTLYTSILIVALLLLLVSARLHNIAIAMIYNLNYLSIIAFNNNINYTNTNTNTIYL